MFSKKYALRIVDRVGGGDSFGGGLIYGLISGMSAKDSLEFAVEHLDLIRKAIEGDTAAFRELQEAAYVNIFGTSSVDFSQLMNGIYVAEENLAELQQMLAYLGEFEIEKQTINNKIGFLAGVDPLTGKLKIGRANLNNTYYYLKPKSTNPLSGRKTSSKTGSGSSGGGGSSSISVSEETEKLIGDMERDYENIDNRRRIAELKKEYHEIRGEIQGVIGYTKIESDIIKEQNKTLEENIATLEKEMKAKEAILAGNKSTSKAYKQAAADLEELLLEQRYSPDLR